MRVVAGKYKGKRLLGPRSNELRPTGDRLKVALFDILRPRLPEATVLDAFAGTGAIGIESLSRGAHDVVFVDSSAAACDLIRRNLQLCGIATGFRLLSCDVFRALRQLAREGRRFSLAYLDPPYHWTAGGDILHLLFQAGLLQAQACVVFEHHRKSDVPEEGTGYARVRIVRQGDKCLSFYAAQGGSDTDHETG